MGESRKAAKPFGIRFAGRLHVFEGEAAILFLVTAVTVTAVTKLLFFCLRGKKMHLLIGRAIKNLGKEGWNEILIVSL